MPAVFGKIGRSFPAPARNGRPAGERIPLAAWGSGPAPLRDWLASALRGLPEWEELHTDAARFTALEKMFADDAVKAAFLTKLFSVSSLDWGMTPALPDDPRSRQIADFHLFNLQGCKGGTRGIVEEVLFAGLVRGYSVCELVGKPEPEVDPPWAGKRCLGQIKAKPNVQLEEDPFGNVTALVAQTKDGPVKYDPADGFVIFKFLPLFGKPTSDLRAAYRAYRIKASVMALWVIGLEKFGQPFFRGKYPANDTTGLRTQLVAALETVKSRTYVALPDGTDIEPVQILSGNHAYYQQALEKCDQAIFTAIAGAFLQNITTGQQTTDPRGDSRVQKSTAELFVWHLAASIADTANDQIVPYWHRMNFAGGGKPRAGLGGVNDADLRPGADLDTALTAMGLPLSKKDIYQRYNRTPPSGPDDALGGPPPGPPAAPAPFGDPEGVAAPPLPPGLDVGPLLTVKEVGQTLRVSRSKVRQLTDAGELPYKRFGSLIRIPQKAVAEYLTKCEGAPAGGGAAAPFSDAAEFCLVGVNAGKPGPCPQGKQGPPRPPRPSVEDATAHVSRLLAGGDVTHEHVQQLGDKLLTMRRDDILKVKRQLGIKASGPKAELARKVAERALAGKPVQAPAAAAAPVEVPKGPAVSANGQPAGSRGNAVLPDHARPKLASRENDAVETYTDTDYKPINDALRAGKEPPAHTAAIHAALQSAMAKAEVFPAPVPVFRGMVVMGERLPTFTAMVEKAKAEGSVVRLPGYTSTATGGVPEGFGGNVELRIQATHGLDAKPLSVNRGENELILNHNSSFRVDKVERAGGRVVVHMTQVGHGG